MQHSRQNWSKQAARIAFFLSHDHICCRDNVLESVSQGEPYGLDAVHSRVLPEMRTLGVTEETLRKITVENVCHLFG